jgi:hypothetical protein
VGRYGVEPERLIPLINDEMVRPPGSVDVYLIDEIGKIECHCPQFIDSAHDLLPDGQSQAILGSDPAAPGKRVQPVNYRSTYKYYHTTGGSSKDLK